MTDDEIKRKWTKTKKMSERELKELIDNELEKLEGRLAFLAAYKGNGRTPSIVTPAIMLIETKTPFRFAFMQLTKFSNSAMHKRAEAEMKQREYIGAL